MSSENGVVQVRPVSASLTVPKMVKALFASGYFRKDVASIEQAYAKIMIGEEFGLTPYQSLAGVTMIEGRLGFMTNVLATFVQQSEKYDYRVRETDNDHCKIEFFHGDESLGFSEWSIEDSERAGLIKPKSNHEKYPKAMCFNRALASGVRMFCPEVTNGTPAYTPDELGAEVDATGAAVNLEAPEPISVDGEVMTDAEVVEPLDDDKVQHLLQGVEAIGMTRDDVNIMLGSQGLDAADPLVNLAGYFETLSEEQFEAVRVELDRLASVEVADTEMEEANAS